MLLHGKKNIQILYSFTGKCAVCALLHIFSPKVPFPSSSLYPYSNLDKALLLRVKNVVKFNYISVFNDKW